MTTEKQENVVKKTFVIMNHEYTKKRKDSFYKNSNQDGKFTVKMAYRYTTDAPTSYCFIITFENKNYNKYFDKIMSTIVSLLNIKNVTIKETKVKDNCGVVNEMILNNKLAIGIEHLLQSAIIEQLEKFSIIKFMHMLTDKIGPVETSKHVVLKIENPDLAGTEKIKITSNKALDGLSLIYKHEKVENEIDTYLLKIQFIKRHCYIYFDDIVEYVCKEKFHCKYVMAIMRLKEELTCIIKVSDDQDTESVVEDFSLSLATKINDVLEKVRNQELFFGKNPTLLKATPDAKIIPIKGKELDMNNKSKKKTSTNTKLPLGAQDSNNTQPLVIRFENADVSDVNMDWHTCTARHHVVNHYLCCKDNDEYDYVFKIHFGHEDWNKEFSKIITHVLSCLCGTNNQFMSVYDGSLCFTVGLNGLNVCQFVDEFVDTFIQQLVISLTDMSLEQKQDKKPLKFFCSKMDGRYMSASNNQYEGKHIGKFAIDVVWINEHDRQKVNADYSLRVCFENQICLDNFQAIMKFVVSKIKCVNEEPNTAVYGFGPIYSVMNEYGTLSLASLTEEVVKTLIEFSLTDLDLVDRSAADILTQSKLAAKKQQMILAQTNNVDNPFPPAKLQVYPNVNGVRILYAIMLDSEFSKSRVVTTIHTFANGSSLGVDESTFGVLRFIISTPDKYINQAPFVEFLTRMHLREELKDHDVLYTNKIDGVYAKEFMLKLTPFHGPEQDESKIFFDKNTIQMFELMWITIMKDHFEKYEPKITEK